VEADEIYLSTLDRFAKYSILNPGSDATNTAITLAARQVRVRVGEGVREGARVRVRVRVGGRVGVSVRVRVRLRVRVRVRDSALFVNLRGMPLRLPPL
jgi:hypothetical protein